MVTKIQTYVPHSTTEMCRKQFPDLSTDLSEDKRKMNIKIRLHLQMNLEKIKCATEQFKDFTRK